MATRVRGLVRHLAGRQLCRRVELDDIVQEVLLRVLATEADDWRRFDDDRLWRYVRSAARHTVIDLVRAMRRARRESLADTPPAGDWSRTQGFDPPAATRGVLTRVIGNEAHGAVDAAFARLSAEHRRVIGFRQFEGLSAEQTGHRMARSATAVHSLYRRALEAWANAVPPEHRA